MDRILPHVSVEGEELFARRSVEKAAQWLAPAGVGAASGDG